jgi:hypothetical protein
LFSSLHLLFHNGAGTFPWQASVFGNSTNDAPINYSILQLNWTADPLQCVLLNQVITLQSRFSNVTAYMFPPHQALSARALLKVITFGSACYVCGLNLRMNALPSISSVQIFPTLISMRPLPPNGRRSLLSIGDCTEHFPSQISFCSLNYITLSRRPLPARLIH